MKLYNICAGRERGEGALRISCTFPPRIPNESAAQIGNETKSPSPKKGESVRGFTEKGIGLPIDPLPILSPIHKKAK